MMKKAFFEVLLVIFLSCTLCGCTPSIKSEEEITADLRQNAAQLANRTDINIGVVTIAKRQTDKTSKKDLVYVDFDFETDDGIAKGNGSCQIKYGLYNDGWILDDIEVENVSYSPLVGPNYTEDDLTEYIESYGYTYQSLYSDFSCQDQRLDIENGIDQYIFEVENIYRYLTEYMDISVTSVFDEMNGYWFLSDVRCENSVEQWNIAGTYMISKSSYSGEEYYVELSNNYLLNDFSESKWGGKLYNLSQYSPAEFFSNIAKAPYETKYKLDRGYSLSFVGDLNYHSFKYCITGLPPFGDQIPIFIGKNAIAKAHLSSWDAWVADDYNRTIKTSFVALVRSN